MLKGQQKRSVGFGKLERKEVVEKRILRLREPLREQYTRPGD